MLPNRAARTMSPVCRGPVTYTGAEALQADIAHFKAALDAAGLADGFMNAVAPGSCSRFGNEFYASEEELLYACADAMREEYQAIIDAGLILQLDDPAIAENWDQINPAPTVADYQRFTMVRVEALNHAIRGLPPERIRFHLCWGSWHGPHTTDIPMADIVNVMLAINAGAYSFEAANVRHEHEWQVWQDVELPDGKRSCPAWSATPPTWSSTPSWSPTASPGSPRAWAGRTWSPPPTAGSAAGCIPRSPGPSSVPSPRAPSWRRSGCGPENPC